MTEWLGTRCSQAGGGDGPSVPRTSARVESAEVRGTVMSLRGRRENKCFEPFSVTGPNVPMHYGAWVGGRKRARNVRASEVLCESRRTVRLDGDGGVGQACTYRPTVIAVA